MRIHEYYCSKWGFLYCFHTRQWHEQKINYIKLSSPLLCTTICCENNEVGILDNWGSPSPLFKWRCEFLFNKVGSAKTTPDDEGVTAMSPFTRRFYNRHQAKAFEGGKSAGQPRWSFPSKESSEMKIERIVSSDFIIWSLLDSLSGFRILLDQLKSTFSKTFAQRLVSLGRVMQIVLDLFALSIDPIIEIIRIHPAKSGAWFS